MRKRDIATRGGKPCLNVKCYHFAPGLTPEAVGAATDADFERATGYAWDSARELFWESAGNLAAEILGEAATVYSAGRSGGWLAVHGLPPVETWDAVAVARWAKFARAIRAEMEDRAAADAVREEIEANGWAKPGAELYNFTDGPDGKTVCLADLKAQAIAAGFGAVVR